MEERAFTPIGRSLFCFVNESKIGRAQAAALKEQQESGDICTRMTVEVVTDEIFALLEYSAFLKTMLDALALEASTNLYEGPPGGEEEGGGGEDETSDEARRLLEALAVRGTPDAAAAVEQLHAEDEQAAIDAGGLE